MSRTLVSQANFAVLGGLLAILVVIGMLTWDQSNAARSDRAWTLHTYQVLESIGDLGKIGRAHV